MRISFHTTKILQQLKKNPPKTRKFRFILDAAFAKSNQFPKLKKKVNLIHVVHEGGLSPQSSDKDIYQLAVKLNRFVITHDDDFKEFVRRGKPGILIIPPYLGNDAIDAMVTSYLSGKNPVDFLGKAIKINTA